MSKEYSSSSENEEQELDSYLKNIDKELKAANVQVKDDEVSRYVNEYFEKNLFKGKGPIPDVGDADSEDLDDVIESSKAEETYNFRFEEAGADRIETHPRRISGEQRVKVSARKRKRQEAKKERDEDVEAFNKEMDEVDEKWHKIYVENGNKFTDEQLTQYNNETADVILKFQGEKFEYQEVPKEGGIAKSIHFIEEEDDEEEDKVILPEEEEEINEDNKEKLIEEAQKKLEEDIENEDKPLESGSDGEEEEKKEQGERKKHRGKRGKHRAGKDRHDENKKRPFRKFGGNRGRQAPKDRASTYQMHK